MLNQSVAFIAWLSSFAASMRCATYPPPPGSAPGYHVLHHCTAIGMMKTVVAVLPDGEATLKRFYKKGDQVRLVPANADMDPIEVHARDVEIRGVLRGLLRRY